MSQRKNRKNKISQPSKPSPEKKKMRRRRDFRRFLMVLTVLVIAGGFGFNTLKSNYEVTHDLSVIGQGVPTVVQIHDPKCQLCLRLRRNASSAIDKMKDENILFRVADITTPEGYRLQRKHNVSNVTLLLFDSNGELNTVLSGVKSDEILHKAFLAHVKRRVNRPSQTKEQPKV